MPFSRESKTRCYKCKHINQQLGCPQARLTALRALGLLSTDGAARAQLAHLDFGATALQLEDRPAEPTDVSFARLPPLDFVGRRAASAIVLRCLLEASATAMRWRGRA